MPRRRIVDAIAVAVIAAVAYVVAVSALNEYRNAGRKVFFYQSTFGPAVSFACGYGFRNVNYTRIPAMADFLEERSDRMSCSALAPQSPYVALETFQGISRYLEMAVGIVWWVRGVSWTVLDPLFGALYAVAIALTYGLFRLGARPMLAAPAALWLAFSPLQFGNLPGLRDFAKAPFVLGLLLLVGVLLKFRRSERANLILCAAAGVTAGIGLGFRNDLLLLIPVLMVAILVPPLTSAVRPVLARAARVVVFVTACGLSAAPIFAAYSRGSNTGHVVLLGMTTPFDPSLKVHPSIYDVGYLYNDSYMYVVVRSYAERVLSASGPMQIGSAEYDRASMRYLSALARQVPADMLARAYASMLGVFRAPFDPTLVDTEFLQGRLNSLIGVRGMAVVRLEPFAAIAAIALIAYAAATLRRDLATGVLIVGVLAAAAALQFHHRHFFYLEFAAWWPLVAVTERALRGIRRVEPAKVHTWNWRLATVILLTIPLSAWCLLYSARRYQQRTMAAVLEQLTRADSAPIELTQNATERGRVRVSVPPVPVTGDLSHPVASAYYAFHFGGPNCDHLAVSPTFRYSSSRAFADLTRDMSIDLQGGDGTAIVYAAGYHAEAPYRRSALMPIEFITTDFEGVELPVDQVSCLTAVRRIRDDQTPDVLMNVILASDWRQAKLYTRLEWEHERKSLKIVALPASLERSRAAIALEHAADGQIDSLATNVERRDGGLVMDGRATGPFTYLATFAPHAAVAGQLAVARGELYDGGITIGLIRNDAWVRSINVIDRGRFSVLLETPENGDYRLVIANYLPDGSRSNHVRIAALGWARE